MSTAHPILHSQSGVLECVFSFLNLYDLDRVQVNKDWSTFSKTCEAKRLTALKTAFRGLQPSQETSGSLISLVCDDTNAEATFESLGKMKKVFRGVHLGVSCLHNWDYVVVMRSRFVILIDDNVYVSELNSLAIRLMRASETREAFESAFFDEFSGMEQYKLPTHKMSKIQFTAWKQKTFSAFRTEKGFSYIKNLVVKDSIVTVRCPLKNEEIIPRIAEVVHRAGLTFTSLYLGTRFYWLSFFIDDVCNEDEHQKALAAYERNVERLKNDRTCIIDVRRIRHKTNPECVDHFQRISYGKNYDPAFQQKE